MNNIVMGLLYIEKNASESDAETESEKADLPKRIEDMRLEIIERIKNETDERVSVMLKKQHHEAEINISRIQSLTEKKRAYIKRQFNENRKKWEEEVFQTILSK